MAQKAKPKGKPEPEPTVELQEQAMTEEGGAESPAIQSDKVEVNSDSGRPKKSPAKPVPDSVHPRGGVRAPLLHDSPVRIGFMMASHDAGARRTPFTGMGKWYVIHGEHGEDGPRRECLERVQKDTSHNTWTAYVVYLVPGGRLIGVPYDTAEGPLPLPR